MISGSFMLLNEPMQTAQAYVIPCNFLYCFKSAIILLFTRRTFIDISIRNIPTTISIRTTIVPIVCLLFYWYLLIVFY